MPAPIRQTLASLTMVLLATTQLLASVVLRLDDDPQAEALRHIVNHEVITGTTDKPIVFDSDTVVSGTGYFENTHIRGVFAPGNSPGITTGMDQAFSGTIEIELSGTTPGMGPDNHDQINDSGTILLFPDSTTGDNPVLKILPFNGFEPTVGDQFKIITWQTGLQGDFGPQMVDPFFTAEGITFETIITNPSPVAPDLSGDLTLLADPTTTVIPEPSAFWCWSMLSAMSLAMCRLARRGDVVEHSTDSCRTRVNQCACQQVEIRLVCRITRRTYKTFTGTLSIEIDSSSRTFCSGNYAPCSTPLHHFRASHHQSPRVGSLTLAAVAIPELRTSESSDCSRTCLQK